MKTTNFHNSQRSQKIFPMFAVTLFLNVKFSVNFRKRIKRMCSSNSRIGFTLSICDIGRMICLL